MSTPFDPRRGLVVVSAEVVWPYGSAVVSMALDTGATGSMLNAALLVALGYDPALVPDRVQVTTGSGVEFVPRVYVERLTALGKVQETIGILCHTLPTSATVDGLLGLDFMRNMCLQIDFRVGTISLE
ncbi:MAG: retropepsin-like aspartic protease [Candidatus Hydrogenedentes bacterium]|nr:retropepsin-like aspartic protease [Candidatus Hydrogenedentota bacterium]